MLFAVGKAQQAITEDDVTIIWLVWGNLKS